MLHTCQANSSYCAGLIPVRFLLISHPFPPLIV